MKVHLNLVIFSRLQIQVKEFSASVIDNPFTVRGGVADIIFGIVCMSFEVFA
jgi:hypothetical protein